MVSHHTWHRVTALALAVTGVSMLGIARVDLAAQAHGARPGLQGTWQVEVTLFDCATGVERPPFWSLLTFAHGGTLTETTANQALPAARTSGHGAWSHARGASYKAASEAFLLFGPAFRSWTQRISQKIEMTSPDRFVSRATVEFALTPGTLPPPPVTLPPVTACARAVGYRMN